MFLSEEFRVTLHQLTHQQESVNSRDAVGYYAGDEFAACGVFTLDENLVPQGRELLIVFLQFFVYLFLSQTDIVKSLIGL